MTNCYKIAKFHSLDKQMQCHIEKSKKRKWIIKGLKNRKSYRLNKLNNNQIQDYMLTSNSLRFKDLKLKMNGNRISNKYIT